MRKKKIRMQLKVNLLIPLCVCNPTDLLPYVTRFLFAVQFWFRVIILKTLETPPSIL